jgi:DNA-directed RNA polymerase subunit alpha
MTEELLLPSVRAVASARNYRKYEIGPLAESYGVVLGNSLRRVLLSSLPGAAVTSLRIEGVQHEFQDIECVREDVTQIVLAVKQLRLRSFSDAPVTLVLEVSGEREVTAADITAVSAVEIVNPELRLATLDGPQARLSMQLVAEVGVGFSDASLRGGQPIGVIPVDALFSPVPKVNFTVERLRLGQSTVLDQLWLEIWTDGSITPDEALRQGAAILVRQFTAFALYQGAAAPARVPPSTGVPIPPHHYDLPIEDLDLSVRSYNCLKRAKISQVGQLLEMGELDLLGIKNFGPKSLQDLALRLRERHLLPADTAQEAPAPPL